MDTGTKSNCNLLVLFIFICTAVILQETESAATKVTGSYYNDEQNDDDFSFGEIKVHSPQKKPINSTLVERKSGETEHPAAASSDFARKFADKKKVSMEHMNNLTVTIEINEVEYTLELTKNWFLFSAEYTEKVISGDKETIIKNDMYAEHCYYIGKVKDYPDSTAALSTCGYVRGAFTVDNVTYSIEPDVLLKRCLSCKHRFFSSNNRNSTGRCGVEHSEFVHKRNRRALIDEWPQDLDGVTRIVELYAVNDNSQFLNQGSVTATLQRMRDAVNRASVFYHSQDIYLVLVGAEVWDTADKIFVNVSDYSRTLDDFNAYSNAFIKQHRDNTMLLTHVGPFADGVVGLAYTSQMCTQSSTFFAADVKDALDDTASTVAHECGHNFGLNHNTGTTGDCPCDDPSGVCIMDAEGGDIIPVHWATCSKAVLKSADTYAAYPCLNNMPATLYDVALPSKCGNGLVEPGEDCDCDDAPTSECNPQCCNNVTCQLTAPAQCAYGRCCNVDTCKLKSRYSACRNSSSDCDVTEYCSGSDPVCPFNVYKADFTSCTVNGETSYCYNGSCNTRSSQCTKIVGTATSDDSCYTQLNVVGDKTGNCGFVQPRNYTQFVPCAVGDALCGTLQCNGFSSLLIQIGYLDDSASTVGGFTCQSIIYSYDIDSGNPGFVQDGSPCGSDMACVSQKCQSIASLTSTNNCTVAKCSNNGVCNSLDQCHCNPGYAPPDCSQPGEGGSIHSNPIVQMSTTITTTTAAAMTTSTSQMTTAVPSSGANFTFNPASSSISASGSSSSMSSVSGSIGNSPSGVSGNSPPGVSTTVNSMASLMPGVSTSKANSGSTTSGSGSFNESSCTQKINCGWGGDTIVYIAIAIGSLLLAMAIISCCCYRYGYFGRPRPMPYTYRSSAPFRYAPDSYAPYRRNVYQGPRPRRPMYARRTPYTQNPYGLGGNMPGGLPQISGGRMNPGFMI